MPSLVLRPDGPAGPDGPVGFALALRHPSMAADYHAMIDRNLDRLREWESWAHHHGDLAGTTAYLQASLDGFAAGTQLPLVVLVDGQLAGSIGIGVDRGDSVGTIGYWVDAAHEGRGLMHRALEAAVSLAFDQLDLARLQAFATTSNTRSRGLLERCGFEHEGTARSAQGFLDERRDLALYGRLRG